MEGSASTLGRSHDPPVPIWATWVVRLIDPVRKSSAPCTTCMPSPIAPGLLGALVPAGDLALEWPRHARLNHAPMPTGY